MYQLIVSAIVHGLHYHCLKAMINTNNVVDRDINKSHTNNDKTKNTRTHLFYKLSIAKNKCFLKYKLFNFEGKYSDMIKLVYNSIISDYEIIKSSNTTIFNFNNVFTKVLNTEKLDILLLPEFEQMDCIISKDDLLCFLFNFFKKLTVLQVIDITFDVDDYENLYKYLIKEEMYILANTVNDVFHLEKNKIDIRLKKDKTYKKLIDYSFILLKL